MRWSALFVVLMLRALPVGAQGPDTLRTDWEKFFTDEGVTGTIVVVDDRTGRTSVYNPERAHRQFSPASTFKLPHALFALDAGIVRDEFQTFRWDSTKREVASWNADQHLRSSMRNSTVWVYQLFARQIGTDREREYLQKIDYGNQNISGGVDRFWLDGGLRISAREQIAFLKKLYHNQLPFKVEHQRLVKDIMIVEAGRNYIVRAKTGWTGGQRGQIGWWIGWVEWHEGPVFFALNIDMPRGGADAPKREQIGRAILRSTNALPAR